MPDLQTNTENRLIFRGDCYWVDFGGDAGIRPGIIVSNDVYTNYSNGVIAVPASHNGRNDLPTHVFLHIRGEDSVARCENVTHLDRDKVLGLIDRLSPEDMRKIEFALKAALWL